MAKTNKEIMDAVIADMPKDDAKALEGVKNGIDFLSITDHQPNLINSFINTLTNKVTKSLIYSKIFSNPLKELKKGKLEYGDSIEELFVQMAMTKNFGEHWGDGSTTPEADLIRKLKPKVTAMYISVNFDKKYKTTVMNKQLRKAFMNEGGLSRLIMQIVGSITSQAEYQEFLATKKVLKNVIEECKSWNLDPEHATDEQDLTLKGKVVKQSPYVIHCATEKEFIEEVRAVTGEMKFPSTKFNLAKELNWCNPEDLVLVTTPAMSAKIDVNVLAGAFNVSSTDIKTRIILVDELPTGVFKASDQQTTEKVPHSIGEGTTIQNDPSKTIMGILMDKDFVQIWDTYQGAGTFYNPEGEYTNHFANREGIFSVCTFANLVVLTSE